MAGDIVCSRSSLESGEPLAGTAPSATGWLVLEDPGPWMHDALSSPGVPTKVSALCRELLTHFGVRTILARHPQRRRLDRSAPRNVWVAHASARASSLRHALVESLEDIGDWDLAGVAQGRLPAVGEAVRHDIEFVCTHGGRDRCCAQWGRARVLARPGTWECSHLGGHRFAATSLVLPQSRLFGRLQATDADDLTVDTMRGASFLAPAAQVADVAVRRMLSLDAFSPLTCIMHSQSETLATVSVEANAGEDWWVTCSRVEFTRSASCDATPEAATTWAVETIEKERPDNGSGI